MENENVLTLETTTSNQIRSSIQIAVSDEADTSEFVSALMELYSRAGYVNALEVRIVGINSDRVLCMDPLEGDIHITETTEVHGQDFSDYEYGSSDNDAETVDIDLDIDTSAGSTCTVDDNMSVQTGCDQSGEGGEPRKEGINVFVIMP